MTDFAKMTVEAISRYLSEAAPCAEELDTLSKDGRAGVRRVLECFYAKRDREAKEQNRLIAMLRFERALWEQGYRYIAGVDEAGRGPLAGPVVAAAVILPENYVLPGLNDSKQVAPARREELFRSITRDALAWSVGFGDVAEIDTINILESSKNAMRRAIQSLRVAPEYVLLDALELSGLPYPQQGIVGGDGLSLSIAAASIVAKVTRDRWMCEVDTLYQGYGFAIHKGYPTAEHREALRKRGSCPLHRKSFFLFRQEEQ